MRLDQRIDFFGLRRWTFAEFGHQTEVLLVDLRLRVGTGRATGTGSLAAAILFNVAGAAARRAHNVVGDVWLVRTQPALVLRRATVGAPRSVGFAQRTVQLGQLAQLHAAQIVVALGHLDALSDDVLDLVDRLLDALGIGGRDERVQRFVFAGQRLAVLAADFTLLDGALAADDDFGTSFLFHGWVL